MRRFASRDWGSGGGGVDAWGHAEEFVGDAGDVEFDLKVVAKVDDDLVEGGGLVRDGLEFVLDVFVDVAAAAGAVGVFGDGVMKDLAEQGSARVREGAASR